MNTAISTQLNQSYRSALLAYYLGQYAPSQDNLADLLTTPEDVYEYLLIDPLVTNAVTTSRVAEAISSIQQYINGITLNMEPGYDVADLDVDQIRLWKMGADQYAIWGGEVELETYPEDYIDPTLRRNKTVFFKDLEVVLNQNQINSDTATDAVLTYLNEFEKVANLDIVSGYLAGKDQIKDIYYFLGRTREQPYTYYWRSLDMSQNVDNVLATGAWSEWLEIGLPLSDDTIVSTPRLALFNNRVYLAWFTRAATGRNSANSADMITVSINLSYLLLNNSWATPAVVKSITQEDNSSNHFVSESNISKLNSFMAYNETGEDLFIELFLGDEFTSMIGVNLDSWLNIKNVPTPIFNNQNYALEKQKVIQDPLPDTDTFIHPIITDAPVDPVLGMAEYLQFDTSAGLDPIRLNTLFAKELIGKANISIDALLSWETQMTEEPGLPTNTDPNTLTAAVPMDFSGANGLYFWELFFHMPWLVAHRLYQEQQYDDARFWFNYIFAPSGTESANTTSKYWNVRPLVEAAPAQAQGLAISYPVDPDAIATANPTHYQKAIFMAYVSNLIAAGDADYRLQTNDSLSQAKLRYCQVRDLLGPRPDVQTVNQWQSETLSDAAQGVSLELRQYERGLTQPLVAQPGTGYAALSLADSNLFVPPLNSQLLSYWNTLDSRLYNLRHNLSLDGTPMNVALYAAPVNPTVLMQQAAQGGALSSSSAGLTATIPPYRFTTMLQIAYRAAATLSQFGQTLLSFYENGDGATLQQLQQQQMLNISSFTLSLQQQAIDGLDADQSALQASRTVAQQRCDFYTSLFQKGISSSEQKVMDMHTESSNYLVSAEAFLTSGATLEMAPNLFGLADGGIKFGAVLTATGLAMDISGKSMGASAERISVSEEYRRRSEEWQITYQQAQAQVTAIDKQLDALTVRQQAAQTALQQAQAEQINLQATLSFLTSRFTQASLYTWLTGQLAALYYQAYDAVLSLCMSTQASWQYEMGDITSTFIQTGAWNDSYHGLLVGETLQFNLRRMEAAWLSRNSRNLELRKTVSLKTLLGDSASTGFTTQRDSGTFSFSLNEELFDADYPGHYLRQLKYVSVTLPVSIGPYQNVRALLTQTSSSTLLKADSAGVVYLRDSSDPNGSAANIISNQRANQQAAISSAENDSGLFVLSFGDARYLPFEGTGAISSWQLSFPNYTSDKQQALLTQLDDVIINVHYTARYGGAAFEQAVSI
jgi:hypothetical protein